MGPEDIGADFLPCWICWVATRYIILSLPLVNAGYKLQICSEKKMRIFFTQAVFVRAVWTNLEVLVTDYQVSLLTQTFCFRFCIYSLFFLTKLTYHKPNSSLIQHSLSCRCQNIMERCTTRCIFELLKLICLALVLMALLYVIYFKVQLDRFVNLTDLTIFLHPVFRYYAEMLSRVAFIEK